MNVSRVLQIQAIAFIVYGIGFFLIPDAINDSIFGWEGTEPIFGRVIGGTFLGLGLVEWRLAGGVVDRAVVWFYTLVPGLFVVAFIWERLADTYTGPDLWYWVNFGVSAVFFVLVGATALSPNE